MNLYDILLLFCSKVHFISLKEVKHKSVRVLYFWFEVIGIPVFHGYSGGILALN